MNHAQAVSDFYNQNRAYWLALSTPSPSNGSCMLNFGYWSAQTSNLHEAQRAFAQEIRGQLPSTEAALHGLEIGCGIGGISIHMLQQQPSWHMTGVDISPAQLAMAQQNAQATGVASRFRVEQGNSMALPMATSTFDFSLCIESSFHYHDKASFFAENFRVLRPGGVAVVADITCTDSTRVRFRQGNFFESAPQYQAHARAAGFELLAARDIGPAVYAPLYEHIKRFNQQPSRRHPVAKYWSLVLSNYADLALQGIMGYHLFTLRKPGS